MKQLSYPMRPNAGKVYHEESKEPLPEDKHQQDGFSELLTVLLGMTLTDGMVKTTLFSLLKDILPYAEPQDRQQIGRILGMRTWAVEHNRREEKLPHRALTSTERLLGILNVLKKYSVKSTSDRFTMLERMIRMRQRAERSGGDMMPLVMDMMGADMSSIMQMMNMFGKNL